LIVYVKFILGIIYEFSRVYQFLTAEEHDFIIRAYDV